MLPGEIEPFAQAHIKAIEDIRTEMLDWLNSPGAPMISFETVKAWADTLHTSQRGFYRFQVCMIDEHKMKERAHEQARHCRLHHKDQ